MSAVAANPAAQRLLPRFAWFAVFYNVLVVLWGALVRATGSGAGCGNHWPLCNGQVIPVSPGFHTVIEFTHRMMTGGSTFVVLGLLVWTFRATARRSAARLFAVSSTVLLLNEAFLGALLVKLGYVTTNQSIGRMVVLSIHFSNTLLLLAALTLTARSRTQGGTLRSRGLHSISPAESRGPSPGWSRPCSSASAVPWRHWETRSFPAPPPYPAAFAQDFAAGSPLLLRLRLIHPASALLAALFVLWLVAAPARAAARSFDPSQPHRTRLANLVLALLGLQFALGIADVLLLAPAWMQLLHLLGADLYWVALVLLAAETVWPWPSVSTQAITSEAHAAATLA